MIEVPRAFEGKRSAPRALRLKALLIVISTGWAAFFIQHMITGFYRIAVVDIVTVILTLTSLGWGLSRGKPERIDAGAHLAMVASCIGIVGVAMLSGQEDAMATWYLTAVPLFAAYQLGTRASIIWAGIVLVLIVAVHLSGNFVRFEPDYVPDANIWFIGKIVLLCVLLGLSVATRRAMDAYLSALNQREALIRQRATELAEARDEALEAVRAKNQFVANISHEIRTPLNGVIGMTSVLLDTQQPDDQREMIKTIQRSSTALLAILNEVLDFSKLEAGAVELEAIPLDLRECVEDVVDLFGRATAKKGIDLYVLADHDVPRWVEGDITYLRQILLNLVANAVKFTDEGAVWVEISTAGEDELHFQVHDTGIGIPDEKVDTVFQSFSQVDPSTSRKYGGTGLGLAISKRLVELMGGEIWVDSEPGRGSTFHITVHAPEVEAPARPLTTHERVSLIGLEIGLIGGPEGTRKSLRQTFKGWGVTPVECSLGALGDATCEELDIAIVFDADGLEQLMEHEPEVPVVLLAALDGTGVRQRALDAGVHAIVHRPARQRSLRQALESVALGDEGVATVPFSTFDPTMGTRLPARILVAEDNPVNQQVAVSVLEKLGYEPDVAGDGNEVLEAIARKPYDILFMDLQMPGKDGLETARIIRNDDDIEQPWIIALTASVNADQRTRVAEAGMNEFVGKPFDVQTLMVAIERWAEQEHEKVSGSDFASAKFDPWTQLVSMFERAPHKLVELIESHIENGSESLARLDEALRDDDRDAASSIAHGLKSSAGQFGSTDVQHLALAIETKASDASEDELHELFAELQDAWDTAVTRLERERDKFEAKSAGQD